MVSTDTGRGSVDSFTPLPANPKVSAIVDRLTSAIMTGEFLPGTRLPSERSLADSLSVGRSTVRRALADLGRTGLVETRLGRFGGTFVLEGKNSSMKESVRRIFGDDLESLKSSLDVIGLGYGMVAQTAAKRRADSDIAAIGEELSAFRAAVESQDAVRSQYADSRFHFMIIEATKQPALHDVIRSLDRKTNLVAPLHMWGTGGDAFDVRALHEHEQILAAISERDSVAAHDLSYDHAQIDLEIITQILDS